MDGLMWLSQGSFCRIFYVAAAWVGLLDTELLAISEVKPPTSDNIIFYGSHVLKTDT